MILDPDRQTDISKTLKNIKNIFFKVRTKRCGGGYLLPVMKN